jgi:hypothetical protein
MRQTRHLLTAFDRPGMVLGGRIIIGRLRSFLESVASLCRWVVKPDEVQRSSQDRSKSLRSSGSVPLPPRAGRMWEIDEVAPEARRT